MKTLNKLAKEGEELVRMFIDNHGLQQVEFRYLTQEDREYHLDTCGYYRPTTISIMVDKCAKPAGFGRQWSWPGYIIDRTPYGVMAHELGHHVHCTVLGWSTDIQETSGEVPLTNYCPNPGEWFAEMFRLFVTNPDLLSIVRPITYGLFTHEFQPVELRTWNEVLGGCPTTLMNACVNHINKAKRKKYNGKV